MQKSLGALMPSAARSVSQVVRRPVIAKCQIITCRAGLNSLSLGKTRRAARTSVASRARLVVSAGLEPGDWLPSLPTLLTDEKKPLSINDVAKESNVLVFVYPKANTKGCTAQACGFNDSRAVFAAYGYTIIGLSADTPEEQTSWKEEQGYQYSLLCDPNHEAMKALGVSDGKSISRSHILIEKGGRILDARIGISSSLSVPEALRFLEANGGLKA